jgi:hypothetical protein
MVIKGGVFSESSRVNLKKAAMLEVEVFRTYALTNETKNVVARGRKE